MLRGRIISISQYGNGFKKVKSHDQGHRAGKWWTKALDLNSLTQEHRCLEALPRLMEGCEKERLHTCSLWEASELPCLLSFSRY